MPYMTFYQMEIMMPIVSHIWWMHIVIGSENNIKTTHRKKIIDVPMKTLVSYFSLCIQVHQVVFVDTLQSLGTLICPSI